MTVAQYFDLFIVLWFPLFFLSISLGAGFATGACIAMAIADSLIGSKAQKREKTAISVMEESQSIQRAISHSLLSIEDSLRDISNIAIELAYGDDDEEEEVEVDSSTTTVFGTATPDAIVSSLYEDDLVEGKS